MKQFLALLKIEDPVVNKLMNETDAVLHKNEASGLESIITGDRLAIAAHEAGLVPKTAERKIIRSKIYQYLNDVQSLDEGVPKVCPSNEFTSKLLSESIEFHKLAFPLSNLNDSEVELSEKFEKDLKMFCYVNTTAVLEVKSFHQFLARYY